LNSKPYLTADLPGIDGQIKTTPADFFVEELPKYQPSGEGQHVYITIEKTNLTTLSVVGMVARALNVNRKAVGYAGLKDAHAVTRQMLSVDGITEASAAALKIAGVKILAVSRHRNKLKLGHAVGNRFVIRVRGVEKSALPVAEAVIAALQMRGVPNYFGEQRFGHRQNSQRLGKALVQNDMDTFLHELLGNPQSTEALPAQHARALFDNGDLAAALEAFPSFLRDERTVLRQLVRTGDAQRAVRALDKRLKRLYVSAYQSYLFNKLLAQRLPTLHTLEWGDVATIHRNGASFVVQDVAVEQPRADTFEISPAGPMFGTKYLLAQGEPGARETTLLAKEGVTAKDFDVPRVNFRGERRPYRIPLRDANLWWDDGIVLAFHLPPGVYATMVMREVMKNDTLEAVGN